MRAGIMAVPARRQPVRGTQLLVEHMGSVIRRPALIAIEIAWRWLFGIPFLLVCGRWGGATLSKMEYTGVNQIDTSNPWTAASQLAAAWHIYHPLIARFIGELWPAAIAWIVISGLGRAILLKRLLKPVPARRRFRPLTVMFFQAVWLCLFIAVVWGWLSALHWIAATHITIAGEPDLIGFFIWAIFVSLGFFTAWALISWTASVAPLLALLEGRSALSASTASFALGKPFISKLAEINLVLGIVKLALLVVAMVFSAAPLPFSDQLGTYAMHLVYAASAVFFFVANDYFQVVRLEAFAEFWKVFRRPDQIRGPHATRMASNS
jgi:hypothetical protein